METAGSGGPFRGCIGSRMPPFRECGGAPGATIAVRTLDLGRTVPTSQHSALVFVKSQKIIFESQSFLHKQSGAQAGLVLEEEVRASLVRGVKVRLVVLWFLVRYGPTGGFNLTLLFVLLLHLVCGVTLSVIL